MAIEHVCSGMAVKEAALQAVRARLRAFGTGVISGIVAGTFVAIFFASYFFRLLESLSQRLGGGWVDLAAMRAPRPGT